MYSVKENEVESEVVILLNDNCVKQITQWTLV